ncbi:hypothetical protein ACFLZB_00805 [Nanoarchaeota archaeon]
MAWEAMAILGTVGLVIGFIVATRLKKYDLLDLLVGAGVFYLFTPAWMTITDIFGVEVTEAFVFTSVIDPLVRYFGLGIVIALLLKKVLGYFKK